MISILIFFLWETSMLLNRFVFLIILFSLYIPAETHAIQTPLDPIIGAMVTVFTNCIKISRNASRVKKKSPPNWLYIKYRDEFRSFCKSLSYIYIFFKKKYVNKIKQNYKNCSSSWISKVYIPSYGRWPLSELNHWWHIECLFAKIQWSFSQYFRTHLHEEKKWIL